ncbi:MAG: hypothetical protein KF824_10455 [Fimbriimonadaceae bacterium]|nr:MAG: hypothetical protein KF824_10455 [Fimbriimonadaceae bacterium]
MKFARLCLTAFALVVLSAAQAMWMRPEEVPTERVIENLNAKLKENPEDWDSRLTLARVYGYAYASNSNTIWVYDGVDVPSYQSVKQRGIGEPTELSINYLKLALSNYNLVTAYEPTNGLAWLGGAFTLGESARWMKFDTPMRFWGKTLVTKNDYLNAQLAAYRKCFSIGLKADFDRGSTFGHEPDNLCREAGAAIIRMIESDHVGEFKPGEKEKIQDAIKRSNERMVMVTPILFPVHQSLPLASLINPSARTKFDLSGDRQTREWPWINAQAAWLVWDPKMSGKITSGRQLFGSATWWMMFRNGYDALDTLDDDHDQLLSGRELSGISVWHDRNSNAVSEPGEVVPASLWGIQAIRTTYDYTSRDALTSNNGIIMRDGQTLPTYDWIPVSHAPIPKLGAIPTFNLQK